MKESEGKDKETSLIPFLENIIADILHPTDENSLDSILELQKELMELGKRIKEISSIDVPIDELLKVEADYNTKLILKM